MRYALLAFSLLSILSTTAQSKWTMTADSMAHGPANDVFKWAGYRATVNEHNRTKTTLYWLVSRELQLAEKEIAAKDSALAIKDTLIAYQTGRISFYAEELRKCQDKKPCRLCWFGAGVIGGLFIPRKQED